MDAEFSALDCISATYGITTAWLGHDPSVLGCEWGYHPRADTVETEWPVEHLGIHRSTPEEILHAWHGTTAELRRHGTPEKAGEYIHAQVRDGIPVIAWVDTFHVPHSAFHGQQHHAHRIVIRSRAESEGEDAGTVFRVVDRYQGSLYDGPLDARALSAAMSSDALGEARRGDPDWRNRTLVVRAGSRPGKPDGERHRAALARNVRESGGIALLADCADELRAAPDAFAALSPVGMIEVSAWFGELASQRALNARFLRAAAEACALPALHERAADADALSRRWEMTRNTFFLRFRKGAATVVRIADLMTRTAALEKEWNERVGEANG
ncbi:BtrH N-terminal domain-containing protein [Streptomyces sp. NPDC059894]|uniref:BtrH N-terminal domain-containing protein n=1 Tax=unclassified Streptomyces TaxID=2593676 RepID=UPI003654ABDF